MKRLRRDPVALLLEADDPALVYTARRDLWVGLAVCRMLNVICR